MLYHSLLLRHDHEIVFNECNESVYQQLIKQIEADAFSCIEQVQTKTKDDIYIYKKHTSEIMIWKCYVHDALFLYLKDIGTKYFKEYLSCCPRCGSSNIIKSIHFSGATKEELEQIKNGELDILPARYNRPVVPIQNWNCKKCQFGWHNSEDLNQ